MKRLFMKTIISFTVFLCVMTWTVQAQFKSQLERQPVDVRSGITSASGSFLSLFSPDRFYMSHSYSLMYYTGGGYSGSLGMLNNTLNFKLADPLFLKVDVGVMHQPFGGPKNAPNQNAKLMHGAELIYKPNNKFQMNIGYSSSPYNYNGFGMYDNPFQKPAGSGFQDFQFGGDK